MVSAKFDEKGFRELAKNTKGLTKSFERTTLRTGLRNAAKPVRVAAKEKVDRDSGQLRRDIKSKVKVTRSGFGYADVGFLIRSFYGRFVETGTSQVAARPFLRPSLDENHQAIIDGFTGSINATIAKVLGKR